MPLSKQTRTVEVKVYSIGIGEARWSRSDGMRWLRERFSFDVSISHRRRKKGWGLIWYAMKMMKERGGV